MARKYQRKTHDEWRVWGFYPTGKEELTACLSYRAARDNLRDYITNAPEITYRLTGPHRVPGPPPKDA